MTWVVLFDSGKQDAPCGAVDLEYLTCGFLRQTGLGSQVSLRYDWREHRTVSRLERMDRPSDVDRRLFFGLDKIHGFYVFFD